MTLFIPALGVLLIPNTTANHTVTDLSKVVVIVVAVDKIDGHGLRSKVCNECLSKKTKVTVNLPINNDLHVLVNTDMFKQ